MCNAPDTETWNHFMTCDVYKEHWKKVHREFKSDLQKILAKNAHEDITISQIDQLISLTIRSSADSITFHLFRQWASEGNLMNYHTNLIRRKLNLSLTSSTRVNVLILLFYLHLFKSMVWIPRCERQVAWEECHSIDQHQKKFRIYTFLIHISCSSLLLNNKIK